MKSLNLSMVPFCINQSFRFGPEIAYVSSLLLRTLKKVKRKTLVGTTDTGMIAFIIMKGRELSIVGQPTKFNVNLALKISVSHAVEILHF